jgi:hypothetical protein
MVGAAGGAVVGGAVVGGTVVGVVVGGTVVVGAVVVVVEVEVVVLDVVDEVLDVDALDDELLESDVSTWLDEPAPGSAAALWVSLESRTMRATTPDSSASTIAAPASAHRTVLRRGDSSSSSS